VICIIGLEFQGKSFNGQVSLLLSRVCDGGGLALRRGMGWADTVH
jgi:hypothetical protein